MIIGITIGIVLLIIAFVSFNLTDDTFIPSFASGMGMSFIISSIILNLL